MLLARFRLEHQFGFPLGGLLGDGFIGNGRLRLDFAAMWVLGRLICQRAVITPRRKERQLFSM